MIELLDSYLPTGLSWAVFLVYVIIVVFTSIRIILDTQTTSKTLAYLLLVITIPVAGIVFYFAFGINYRRSKSTRKISLIYREITDQLMQKNPDQTDALLKKSHDFPERFLPLVRFMQQVGAENLTENHYQLLINGEQKFPEVLRTLETARNHIHMEYYAWENDTRGNQVKEVLLKKAAEKVHVRVIYDAYASRKIKNNIVRELRDGGVEIYPIIKVKLARFANRVNHRDHRKIIVVDGRIGFVGGINVSDRYDNSIDTGLYWRDTHVKITGPGAANLQRHFLINWNACQPNRLDVNSELFPDTPAAPAGMPAQLSQVMAGGPIYPLSNIMLTYARMFSLAEKKLYITNPYFIPNETILDTLKQAARSGVDVRLLLPKKSDSAIVGAASCFYFRELLYAGVKIFLYKKGFVHAKTAVADGRVSIVGTANMDIRSFDLNFEIMPVIYGEKMASALENAFHSDLKECEELTYANWMEQGKPKFFLYAFARLISSFL